MLAGCEGLPASTGFFEAGTKIYEGMCYFQVGRAGCRCKIRSGIGAIRTKKASLDERSIEELQIEKCKMKIANCREETG